LQNSSEHASKKTSSRRLARLSCLAPYTCHIKLNRFLQESRKVTAIFAEKLLPKSPPRDDNGVERTVRPPPIDFYNRGRALPTNLLQCSKRSRDIAPQRDLCIRHSASRQQRLDHFVTHMCSSMPESSGDVLYASEISPRHPLNHRTNLRSVSPRSKDLL